MRRQGSHFAPEAETEENVPAEHDAISKRRMKVTLRIGCLANIRELGHDTGLTVVGGGGCDDGGGGRGEWQFV